MIFYFSGTGNSQTIAQRISQAIGEETFRITSETPPLLPIHETVLGFIFPVYGWDVPPIVKKFIRNLRIDENSPKYIFMVCTCGDDIGHTDKRFFRLLKEKGWECHAAWSVLMPDTYIGLPGFEIDSEEEINQKLSAACQQTQQIAQSIIKREKNIRNLKNGKFAWTKTHILGWAFYHWLTGDHKFHTKSNCTHCGKCAKVCPLNNITYTTEGFPKWNGHCSDCLACYHHCPQRAIEYGRFSKGKGQYRIPKKYNTK